MRYPAWIVLLLLGCLSPSLGAANFSFWIHAEAGAQQNTISENALKDFEGLLDSACHCKAEKPENATVVFNIYAPVAGGDTIKSAAELARDYPYFHTPTQVFKWESKPSLIGSTSLHLSAPTANGIASGLYALLQEKLGFKFLHPRQTVIPQIEQWPLGDYWSLLGNPDFDKRGFHLHTMHPLELTEPLHDPAFPKGMEMIKAYILWLARNGQNYFDFCLLEGVDDYLEEWVDHASEFNQYAKDRGVLCGIDLSLHMVQQKAFKLVEFKPKDFRSAEKQIRSRLQILMRANWDFINLEFSLAEFVGGLEKLRNRMRDVVLDELKSYPNTKLIGRQHVVKPENEIGGKHDEASLNVPESNKMGLLVHSVMCYALEDSTAPVYELENFQHLYDMLIAENKVRETWYYPESAYWVTFDNSIPLFLLPYLGARWRDIQTVRKLGIPGHVTFSSGWEWGYWLVDWSIARWSWSYSENGKEKPTAPLQYLKEIWENQKDASLDSIYAIQNEAFIAQNLLQYLCPTNPTDELPKKFSKQFQPRMDFKWGEMGKRNFVEKHPEFSPPIDSLFETALVHTKVAEELSTANASAQPLFNQLRSELIDALRVTGLRCLHQSQLLRVPLEGKEFLDAAIATRAYAQELVLQQEKRYRYPINLLTGEYKSFTAYDFGYLHTVHDLHFWKREEAQLRRRKTSVFFRNKYDLIKIAGFKD